MDASKLKALTNLPPEYMQMYGMLPEHLSHLIDDIDEFKRVMDNAKEALEGLFGGQFDLLSPINQQVLIDSLT